MASVSPVRSLAAASLLALAGACSCGSSRAPAPPAEPGPGGAGDGGAAAGGDGAADAPAVAGCPVFPADHPWNVDVSGAEVDPRSEEIVARWPGEALKLAVGTTEEEFGMPYTIVGPDQPLVPIEFGTDGLDFSHHSDPGPFPIPLDAPIQGGGRGATPSDGDRHLLVVQSGTCLLFEAYNAVRTPGGFRVSAAARWDLRSGAPRPPGWTSADGAGLAIFPGLVRWEEIEAGRIAHALRVTLPDAGGSYVPPANHCVGSAPPFPPFGLRARLRADFDETPYAAPTRVLLRALKRHGMIFSDQGAPWTLSGTSHPGFDVVLRDLRARPVPGSAFEVLRIADATGC